MEQTWVYKIILIIVIVSFVCLYYGCSGDDSCAYIVSGCVKNGVDSLPLTNVKVSLISYDLGHHDKGTGSSNFSTDSSGIFSFDILLTPQRAHSCPGANEVEYHFKYEKSGFSIVDTVHAKGTISDGGIGKKDTNILSIPTIYLKPL